MIDRRAFEHEKLTAQELFGQLRPYQVEHLGQVRRLNREATGEVSVFYFKPDETRQGLPIFPDEYNRPLTTQGGQLRVRSEPGAGSTFFFTLARAYGEA